MPFYDSKQDSELPLLSFYLLSIASYKDLREANKEHIKLEYFLAQTKKEISLDDRTTSNLLENISVNDAKNENSIINNIKLNMNNNSPTKIVVKNNQKDYDLNNNMKLPEFCLNDNKEKEFRSFNQSEKRLFYEISVKRNSIYKKKFNTVKLESFKIVDFFDKWKNAYLKLALKK